MKGKILITFAALLTALNCFGWGQKGHDTTAFIAENHLTQNAKQKIEAALGGKSIVYYANWLDNASNTPQYAYTKTWHYKNIDADQSYEQAPINPSGDVVTAIKEQINKLSNGNLSQEDEALAIKILVHLMGDIHQPMHLGHLSDLGGNRIEVNYFNRPTKLHSLWDTPLVESAHNWGYSEWQQQIDRMSSMDQELITSGTIDEWARETYLITRDVYKDSPAGANLSYDYINKWTPTIELQFERGGLRLAYILNSIFDKK